MPPLAGVRWVIVDEIHALVRVGTFFHVAFRFCDALMIPSPRR